MSLSLCPDLPPLEHLPARTISELRATAEYLISQSGGGTYIIRVSSLHLILSSASNGGRKRSKQRHSPGLFPAEVKSTRSLTQHFQRGQQFVSAPTVSGLFQIMSPFSLQSNDSCWQVFLSPSMLICVSLFRRSQRRPHLLQPVSLTQTLSLILSQLLFL